MLLGHQRGGERGRSARVLGGHGDRLVGHQLALHDDAHVRLERLDLEADRGDRALGERHEPRRLHAHRAAGRRPPLDLSGQQPRPQVQPPLVAQQLAVADVERLVVDEQPDQLAVGDVDDRLAVLRVAVGGLRVRQRAGLVEAVEVGAREPERLALVEVAAQADVPVGEREHRLGVGEAVEVQLGLAQRPGLGREHRALAHSSSSRSWTTRSAPCSASASACPTRSTPITTPKFPALPGLDAGQRVLEHRRLRRASAPSSLRALEEGVRLRLAREPALLGHHPVHARLDQRRQARDVQDLLRVRRGGDDRAAQPGVARRLEVAPRALVDVDALLADLLLHRVVLAVAELDDELLLRLDPARLQERAGRRRSAASRPRSARSRSW